MVAITFLDLAAIVLASTALVETLGGRTLIRPFHTRLLLVSPWRPMLYGAGLVVLRILFARRVPPLPALRDPAVALRLAAERARFAQPEPPPPELKFYAVAVVLASLLWLTPHLMHPRRVPDPGDPVFSAWRLAVIAHQLTHDPRHLFDANIFYPAPKTLTYSDATLLEGFAAAPFIAAGADPLLVSNLLFFAAFPACGLAFFYVSWRLTSDLRASFVAGVLGALYPFHSEHYSHLELQYLCFVPLAFLGLLRMFAAPGWRTGLAFGSAVAAQWLACMYFGMMLMTVLLPFTAMVLAAWRIRPTRSLVAALGVAAIPVAAGLLLLGVPYMQSRAERGERDLTAVRFYSATPADYGHPHGRLASYQWVSRATNRPEREIFPGSMPLALAAVGIWPPLGVAQAATIVSGALAFDWSLGVNGLLYDDLYHYVLPYRGMRVPARFAALAGCALVLLSAYGARRLLRIARAPWLQGALFALLAALALVDLRPTARMYPYLTSMPAIYASVRPEMVLAEFPSAEHEFDYMYFSTRHWAKLVNGASGFAPPWYQDLDKALTFPWPASIEMVRGLGATHVTVNCAFLSDVRCENALKALDANAALALAATSKWRGAEQRLYRFK
ncbi:MAG: hypothetical protein DMF85_05735 [Acidobacteria bacterium]|nr:MAG: hypothetical protein DMF85_05735 [Acidobacteriota bacterium]